MKLTQFLDFRKGRRPWDSLVAGLEQHRDQHAAFNQRVRDVGLVDLGKGRSQHDRSLYIQEVIQKCAPHSKLLVTGRSLADWSLSWRELQEAIQQKHLLVKVALLDVDAIRRTANGKVESWIEKPIPDDWALSDVSASFERFRRIIVKPNTGSLAIYSLPFFVPQSFVAYKNDNDGHTYCLQEIGMATDREERPYLVLLADDRESYGGTVEWINEAMLTNDRLKLYRDGMKNEEHDLVHRGKLLAEKVQRLGLVDLAPTRMEREWFQGDLLNLIEDTPDGGEIFIVGRSLALWANHNNELATAIVDRGLRCRFCIADPTLEGLQSLVEGDYAEQDLGSCWEHFLHMADAIEKHATNRSGSFELYGIPAYLPTTFAAHSRRDGIRFCSLEAGIGVGPGSRPIVYFQKVSDNDIYRGLYEIFSSVIKGRIPLLKVPNR